MENIAESLVKNLAQHLNHPELQKELNNAAVDWDKIKEILQGIATALQAVALLIPVGIIKNLLLGVAAVINLVIGMLPNSLSGAIK